MNKLYGFFQPDVPTVEAQDVQTAIDNEEEAVMLDVRTPAEYAKSRIKNSINLPVDEVEEKIESIITDKKKKIYVYCLSGSRSVMAVDTMIKLGYSNVYNMKSGLLAWRINKFQEVQ